MIRVRIFNSLENTWPTFFDFLKTLRISTRGHIMHNDDFKRQKKIEISGRTCFCHLKMGPKESTEYVYLLRWFQWKKIALVWYISGFNWFFPSWDFLKGQQILNRPIISRVMIKNIKPTKMINFVYFFF